MPSVKAKRPKRGDNHPGQGLVRVHWCVEHQQADQDMRQWGASVRGVRAHKGVRGGQRNGQHDGQHDGHGLSGAEATGTLVQEEDEHRPHVGKGRARQERVDVCDAAHHQGWVRLYGDPQHHQGQEEITGSRPDNKVQGDGTEIVAEDRGIDLVSEDGSQSHGQSVQEDVHQVGLDLESIEYHEDVPDLSDAVVSSPITKEDQVRGVEVTPICVEKFNITEDMVMSEEVDARRDTTGLQASALTLSKEEDVEPVAEVAENLSEQRISHQSISHQKSVETCESTKSKSKCENRNFPDHEDDQVDKAACEYGLESPLEVVMNIQVQQGSTVKPSPPGKPETGHLKGHVKVIDPKITVDALSNLAPRSDEEEMPLLHSVRVLKMRKQEWIPQAVQCKEYVKDGEEVVMDQESAVLCDKLSNKYVKSVEPANEVLEKDVVHSQATAAVMGELGDIQVAMESLEESLEEQARELSEEISKGNVAATPMVDNTADDASKFSFRILNIGGAMVSLVDHATESLEEAPATVDVGGELSSLLAEENDEEHVLYGGKEVRVEEMNLLGQEHSEGLVWAVVGSECVNLKEEIHQEQTEGVHLLGQVGCVLLSDLQIGEGPGQQVQVMLEHGHDQEKHPTEIHVEVAAPREVGYQLVRLEEEGGQMVLLHVQHQGDGVQLPHGTRGGEQLSRGLPQLHHSLHHQASRTHLKLNSLFIVNMSTVVSMSVNTYTGARVLTYNNRVLINRKTRVLAELKCTGQVQEMHGSEDACSQNYGQHHIPCQLAAPLHPQPEPDDLADEVEGLSQGQVHCALLQPQHLSYEIISQASLVYRQASCLQIDNLEEPSSDLGQGQHLHDQGVEHLHLHDDGGGAHWSVAGLQHQDHDGIHCGHRHLEVDGQGRGQDDAHHLLSHRSQGGDGQVVLMQTPDGQLALHLEVQGCLSHPSSLLSQEVVRTGCVQLLGLPHHLSFIKASWIKSENRIDDCFPEIGHCQTWGQGCEQRVGQLPCCVLGSQELWGHGQRFQEGPGQVQKFGIFPRSVCRIQL